MKKGLLLVVMAVIPIMHLFSQNEYIVKTKSFENKNDTIKLSLEQQFVKNNFRYIPMNNWDKNMKFMVEKPYESEINTYSIYTDHNHIYPSIDRKLLGDKIFTIDSVSFEHIERIGVGTKLEKIIYFNCEGRTFKYSFYNNDDDYPCIYDLIYLGDIENCRKLLIGKTLYTLNIDWLQDGVQGVSKYSRKWVPVIIKKIGVGDSQNRPIKIIFEYNKKEFYIEVSMSKTNCTSIADNDDNFNTNFSFTNPKLRYPKIPKDIWDLICINQVRIGMTKAQCRLSWGDPEDINKTSGNWGTSEQWVYSASSYLYFKNGILSTIQH